MFALIALGMCFVIMTGGIDLSVGSIAAMASVVAALLSPYGLVPGLLGGVAAGAVVGIVNGLIVTRLGILPFIATLATMLAASGTGLLLADNQSVSVSYDTDFTELGQGDRLGLPVPALMAAAAYVAGLGPAQLHRLRPLRAGGRRRRGRGAADGPAGRPGEVPGLRCSAARWPASPASSSRPSSAPASRPRASAGSCSPSPRSWSAARC